jgi:uncharacterized protein (DUF2252 family)
VRANPSFFYEQMSDRRLRKLPDAPAIWISGDCHVENLGAVSDAHGVATVAMNDLDEAIIHTPVFDLLRLSLSIAMAMRTAGMSALDLDHAIAGLAAGYAKAVELRAADAPVEYATAPLRVRNMFASAGSRSQKHLLARRTEKKKRPRFPIGPKYWPLTKSEKQSIAEIIASPPIHALVTTLSGKHPDSNVSVIDSVFRVAGLSSLGAWRAAALVCVTTPVGAQGATESSPHETFRILDIKEALPLRAPRLPKSDFPKDDADRVVAGACVLAPYLGHRTVAATVGGLRTTIHELMPHDEKIGLADLKKAEATDLAAYLGSVVGRAHGRQLHKGDAKAWLKSFTKAKATCAGTPRWLWDELAYFIGNHEEAYLHHCGTLDLAPGEPTS